MTTVTNCDPQSVTNRPITDNGITDNRPYKNLMFHNFSARQGSSYCYRAHLNFHAFALRDMKIVTREDCRVGQNMSYHFSFC